MSSQNRKLERREINRTVRIRDVIANALVGELVNITTEGMMLISDREVTTNSIFQLRLELPEPINNFTTIDVGVDCLWCRTADNFGRFWSGYQIIDASPAAIATIEALISNYAD